MHLVYRKAETKLLGRGYSYPASEASGREHLLGGPWLTCIQTTWEVLLGCHLQPAESDYLARFKICQFKEVSLEVDMYPDTFGHDAIESC